MTVKCCYQELLIKQKCLTLIFAIKKFQNYIYDTEFIVQTDHQPLAYIQHCKIDSSRTMRWALYLQNHRFNIEAIKGVDDVGAVC
jgi:DNA-dependent RNA polymerase auxiliary subunit epsilon